MLKILGDFTPYGKEFISTYPHLAECSQSNSTRSLKTTDFTKLLEQQHLRRTTAPPPQVRTEQPYQLSSASIPPCSTLSTIPTPQTHITSPVDEELYIQNNTVIWSRGRHIIKTFQYELQPVEMALFAWFPIDQPEHNDHIVSIDQLITNRKRKATLDSKASVKRKRQSTLSFTESLLEAEQQSKYTSLLDHSSTSLPIFSQKDTNNNDNKLQKAACIILKDCVKVHFIDGQHHSIHLPFTVQRVIPSDIGLILERASQSNVSTTSNKSKGKDPFVSGYPETSPVRGGLSVSPFLCLVHPADEFKPIFFLDQLSMSSTSLFDNGDSSTNFFQQQQLVYASFTVDHRNDSHESLPTLVVTKSKSTGLHSIWRYQTASGGSSNSSNGSRNALDLDSSDDEMMLDESRSFFLDTPSFHLDTRSQQLRQPKQDQTDTRRKQGRRSKKAPFSMKGNKRRQRQQKQQQVSPDSPFGGGGGTNNSSIMYHSPSPTPSLTSRKDSFLAGSRSFIQADEDPSTLSMISPGDNNSMLAIYQDALDDSYGEKCQLQHLWTEERRPHINPMVISKGFLSHNAKGLLVLCIMNETEGILLGLVVKDLLASKHSSMHSNQQVTAFQIDAKQALPIYNATRSGNVADILLLDHQNNLSIFVDVQLPYLPILFSSKEQQRHIRSESRLIKIHDAVDNRFNLVIMDKDNNGVPGYRTKRCQIDDIIAGGYYSKSSNRNLVTSSSMALQCAWASSTLWNLFQHQSLQLQYLQKDRVDGWQVFVTALLSMIPLAPLPNMTSSSSSSSSNLGGLYENCMTKAFALQRELNNRNINHYIMEPHNIALVIRALHVVYQEYHLSKFFSKSSVNLLGTLLWLLARIVRSSAWVDCYHQYDVSLEANISYQLDTTLLHQDHQQQELPLIGDGLISLDRPFMFESWMHYHLPQNLTASLPQLCGLPTLDPESPQLLAAKEDTSSGIDTSSTAKIQRRHNEFGFKLKMIWYIQQTMYFHLPGIEENLLQSSASSLSSRLLDTARQRWIEALVKKGYRRNDLETVSDSCILLTSLWNTLAHLQLNPPIDQAMDFYRFIGRNDIVAQLDRQQVLSVMNNAASLSTCDLKSLSISLDKKNGHQPNISQLIAPSTANYAGLPSANNTIQARSPSFYQSAGGDLNLSRFFYVDKASTLDTLKHVRTMLNPCHLVEMTVPDQPGISDENLDAINQGYLKDLIQRTLALSIGNGIFHYGHQHSPASGLLPPPPPSPLPNAPNAPNTTESHNRSLTTIEESINLSAKLLPLRRTVTWNDQAYRPEYLDWPRFHHGVATALRLSSPRLSLFSKRNMGHGLAAPLKPRMASSTSDDYFSDGYLDDDDDKNDLSWLFYVEPEELNVFHGGLLFGLGLNGHLLPNLHWYRYITQSRCSLVTMAFILGTCVTFRGSKNTDIIKILSVHVPSLVASQTAAVAATAAPTSIGAGVGASSSSSGSRILGKDDDLMTSSCLFGLGLIFMGSCDRYMTTVMLNEIGNCAKRANANCGSGLVGDPSVSGATSSSAGLHGGGRPTSNLESACALAAGIALGLIMLGKGGTASKEYGGLPDAQLFDTLYNYMTGKTTNVNHTKSSMASESSSPSSMASTTTPVPSSSSGPSSVQHRHREHKQQQGKGTQVHYSQGSSSLLDITTPAATIALGLAYLKTENRRVADRLDVSDTTKPYLSYVRPDFLLLRVVAKNLILWQSITPSQAWIDSHLPSFMQQGYSDNQGNTKAADDTLDGMDEQVINQAKYNTIAGACLCLGLRFAGSQDTKAFDCLLDHLDTFMKLAVAQATTFQDHITKSAVWVCIDVIATAAAMVMAGSGHEELYKRLKILHDRVPFGGGATGNGRYSNHMASHMAMGLLFCGLGRYTLKTTNEAIAGLLCAFYPFYPIDPEDQRSHLQAFRHLWVMGLDQRWLTPIDCDTKQICQVPLLLTITTTSSPEDDKLDEDNNGILQDKAGRQRGRQQQECRVVAPSVVPNYDTLARIQVDSSLYYPLNIDMQIKGDYQQAIRQSGILFVQRKR